MTPFHLLASCALVTIASALPQVIAPDSLCTKTLTDLGIDATVTHYASWMSSMSALYGTAAKSGDKVPVHTTIFTFPGLGLITAYGYFDSHALTSAGYKIITNTLTITTSCPTTTATLPPSPTGSICSPHGDHCTSPQFPSCLFNSHGFEAIANYA